MSKDNIEEKVILGSGTPEDEKEAYYEHPLDSEVSKELSGQEKKEIAEDICEKIRQSLDDSEPRLSKLRVFNSIYELVPDSSRKTMGGSNVTLPVGAFKLDGIVDKLSEHMNELDRFYEIESDNRDETKLRAINKLFQDILIDEVDFYTKNEGILHNAGKDGTAIGAVTFDVSKKRRTKMELYENEINPDTGQPMYIVDENNRPVLSGVYEFKQEYPTADDAGVSPEEYRRIIRNIELKGREEIEVEYNHVIRRVCLDIINRSDFVISPANARNQEESTLKGMRVWNTIQDFEKGIECGRYKAEDIDILKEKLAYDKNKDKPEEVASTDETESEKASIEGIQPLGKEGRECFFCIYRYDLDGDGIDEDVIVEVDYKEEVLLLIDKYIYWDAESFFNKWVLRGRVNRFDGISIIERLEHLIYELNTLHNQRNDFWNFHLINVFLQDADLEINPDPSIHGFELGRVYTIKSLSGKPISEALMPLFKLGSGIPEFINEEMQILKYIDDVTVSDQLLTGKESPSDPNAPASKTIALLKVALSKIAAFIRYLRPGYEDFGKKVMWRIYQFGNDSYDVKIDDEIVTVTRQDLFPEDLKIRFALTSKNISKEIEKQNALFLAQTALSFPIVQQNPFGQKELLDNIIKKSGQDIDTDVITMTQEQMVQMVMAQFQEMQQQQEQEQAQAMQDEINAQIPEEEQREAEAELEMGI